jgi:hypothetical protein
MSSLVTQMIIAEKYGPRLNIEQLADALGLNKGTIYNRISAGTFSIKTYVDGGKRWADHRDVAEHFEAMRKMAA